MKDYIVQFSGLILGNYTFEFRLEKRFFDHIESDEFLNGDVKLDVFLLKSETMMEFNFVFEGTVQCICDRCLEEFMLPIKGEHSLFVKFGEEYQEVDDEMIVLPIKEHQIDLYPFIHDFLMTSMPLQKIHAEDKEGNSGCNMDMIQRINDNQQKTEEEIDPRWEKLNILKNNNK